MYCPQCGGMTEDSSRFCSACGLDLERYREQWQQPGTQTTSQAASAGSEPNRAAYQPPPYQPPPYQQQYQSQYQQSYQPPQHYRSTPTYGTVPRIPSYMGWAIATLILCFWPTGIVAVVYASKVGNKLALGDITGAQSYSRKAKIWCWVTFGIAIAWIVIAILVAVFAATTSFTVY